MTLATRDPWADATQLVTQTVLDDGLAAVRRRAWRRQALVFLVGASALAAAVLVAHALTASSPDALWRTCLRTINIGSGLGVLGLA